MIYLIRHAEVEANITHTLIGRGETPVTENGYDQIGSLKDRFSHMRFNSVLCSPSIRAKQTAEVLNSEMYGFAIYPNLLEHNLGEWEGRDAQELYGESKAYRTMVTDLDNFHPEEGSEVESVEQLRERLNYIRKELLLYPNDIDIAVVSHGFTLRVLFSELTGVQLKDTPWFDNTSVTILEKEAFMFKTICLNNTDHVRSLHRFKSLAKEA
jgi:broad specificity phosphatase PhoE